MHQYTTTVQNLYVAYFNRPADPSGLNYWESVVAARGGDISAVSASFSQSIEYQNTYAKLDNASIVNAVYRNLFGRDAEVDGRNYWARNLDAKNITIDNVVAEISNGARGNDSVVFNSRVAAANTFSEALAVSNKLAIYSGDNALALARAFLAQVSDEASLTKAQSSVTTTLEFMESNIDLGGKIPTLFTAGQDRVVGNASDQLYFEQVPRNGKAFNDGDSLDGGAGDDSLYLISKNSAPYALPSNVTVRNIENLKIDADRALTADVKNWAGLRNITVNGSVDVNLTAGASAIKINSDLGHGSVRIIGGTDVTLQLNKMTTGGAIEVGYVKAPTGDINLNANYVAPNYLDSPTPTTITLNGGKSVNIALDFPQYFYSNDITPVIVNGNNTTSTVSYSANFDNVKLTVNDINFQNATEKPSITKVILGNRPQATINDIGLQEIDATNTKYGVAYINNASSELTNASLKVLLGKGSLTLGDAGKIATLNVELHADNTQASTLTLNDFIHSARMANLKNINVSGNGILQSEIRSSSLQAISLSENAGLDMTLSNVEYPPFGSHSAPIIDASKTHANNQLSFFINDLTYKGGSGKDILSFANTVLQGEINLGAGDDSFSFNAGVQFSADGQIDGGAGFDTVHMYLKDAAALASDGSFATYFSNFEALNLDVLDGAPTYDFDVQTMGNPIKAVWLSDFLNQQCAVSFHNLPSNGELTLRTEFKQVTIDSPRFIQSTSDVFNIVLGEYQAVDYGTINLAGVETVNISNSTSNNSRGLNHLVLADDNLQKLKVASLFGLNLVNSATTVKTVDASAIGGDGFTWTSGALTAPASIVGSLTAPNQLDFAAAKATLDITTGSAADVITLSGSASATLHLGTGADRVIINSAGANASVYTTIADPHKMSISLLPTAGTIFNAHKLELAANASLENYLNGVINAAGDSHQISQGGWFHFANDTYFVQSHHNAITTPNFVNGTDFIVKLTGLFDLSTAQIGGGNGNTLNIG